MSQSEIVADNMYSDNPNQVACTQLSNGYLVSTIVRDERNKAMDSMIVELEKVLLGEELTDRPAMLSIEGDYETMIFDCDENGEIKSYQERGFARYMSREEAETGHKEMVEKWRRMNVRS